MPFTPQNRRLTILSIITLALIVVTAAIMLFASPTPKQDRLLGVLIVILGFAALWWKSEWEGRKTRHDVRDPMQTVVNKMSETAEVNAETTAKAQQAATVTVEAFEVVKNELAEIKRGLNGELDKRIVATVVKVLDERGLTAKSPPVQT